MLPWQQKSFFHTEPFGMCLSGKWSKREYDAMAAKGYTPEAGTYVKAAYTKNKADYSFVLMPDRK